MFSIVILILILQLFSLQLIFSPNSGLIFVVGTQDSEFRTSESLDIASVVWTPLQVVRPIHNKKGEQEVIVSVPEGRIDAGNILGIMGPSGCGKVNSD